MKARTILEGMMVMESEGRKQRAEMLEAENSVLRERIREIRKQTLSILRGNPEDTWCDEEKEIVRLTDLRTKL